MARPIGTLPAFRLFSVTVCQVTSMAASVGPYRLCSSAALVCLTALANRSGSASPLQITCLR
ncbi:Permease of the drug/metabolite transporter superfamily [Pseudomonas syringae pv. actinidiae]|uniref:Permease of the drug/metabolite transporter superfamily n=1 Tax=Pseudomonas syringae pv. actinidiae TaxID=103796 RepID=A0AAN4TJ42_PSESF|nr:Permease of the drug/metabolite transporter superfamily [Pseudomonas syringae pv. actinidiae]